MKKIIILTAAVLASGAAGIAAAIKENPEGAADDILLLETQRAAAVATTQDALDALERATSAPQVDVPSFVYDGDTYMFAIKSLIHKGKRITYEDVIANEDLQKELIERNSGMIVKQ